MKTSELAEEVGLNKLHVGRVRRKVSPDHQGGPLEDWEIAAIKKELGVITGAKRKRLIGLYGDPRFPGFIEATDDENNKVTVQIPGNYEPEMFIGRSFLAEKREYSPGCFCYTYNPFKQDD